MPFVSTTHFHTLFALEVNKIDPKEVKLLNMQPNAIAAAWERGDIDAAFIWDPALGRIKKSGEVLLTSGDLSKLGKATFDGMVRAQGLRCQEREVHVPVREVDGGCRQGLPRQSRELSVPIQKTPKKIVKLVGGEAKDVAGVLALYDFPDMKAQASNAWLGGGKDGGAAKALFFTSEFLKKEKKVDAPAARLWCSRDGQIRQSGASRRLLR